MSLATDQWQTLGPGNLIVRIGVWLISLGISLAVLFLTVVYFKAPVRSLLLDNLGLTENLVQTTLIVLVVLWLIAEVLTLIWIYLAHRRLRYRLGDDAVVAKGGVYTTFTHTIPRSRVQSVEVKAGPIQRLLGLATVKVTTAGVYSADLEIENLRLADAEAIQAQMGVDHVN